MSTMFAEGFDTGYAHAIERVGRGDHTKRMAPPEYFWSYWFKFDLRDATRSEQEAVRTVFFAQRLELDGFTERHAAIVEMVLGQESEARRMVARGHTAFSAVEL